VAEEERDTATGQFLEWYVKEQVEEEESSDEVLNLVKAAGEDRAALAAADKKLGERRFRFPRGFEIFPYSSVKQ
jgi:ferritin